MEDGEVMSKKPRLSSNDSGGNVSSSKGRQVKLTEIFSFSQKSDSDGSPEKPKEGMGLKYVYKSCMQNIIIYICIYKRFKCIVGL